MAGGDRVGPFPGGVPGENKKPGKAIALPRPAPLVQPGKVPIALQGKQGGAGKRSRVAADGGATSQSGMAVDTQVGKGPIPGSRFAETDDNGYRQVEQEEKLQRYAKMAEEKCKEAQIAAAERAKARQRVGRPKHVWWGFHFFWPPELLQGTGEREPMDDPEFLARVQSLMKEERIVETFSIFDIDGSGAIDAHELRPMVEKAALARGEAIDPDIVDDMVKSLDLNKDGEVDLWEFCVAYQKKVEGISLKDKNEEMDLAFNLILNTRGDGRIGEEELRRAFTRMGEPTPKPESLREKSARKAGMLSEEDFQSLLADLDKWNLSVRNGQTVSLVCSRLTAPPHATAAAARCPPCPLPPCPLPPMPAAHSWRSRRLPRLRRFPCLCATAERCTGMTSLVPLNTTNGHELPQEDLRETHPAFNLKPPPRPRRLTRGDTSKVVSRAASPKPPAGAPLPSIASAPASPRMVASTPLPPSPAVAPAAAPSDAAESAPPSPPPPPTLPRLSDSVLSPNRGR